MKIIFSILLMATVFIVEHPKSFGVIAALATSNNARAQTPSYGSGGSPVDTSFSVFETPVATPRYEVIKIKKSGMHVKTKKLILDSMKAANLPISNDKYIWMDQSTGEIKASKRDSLLKMLNQSLSFISNTTSIPAAQVNADWSSGSGVSQILNKPTIPAQYTLSQGANITLTGSYPNQTLSAVTQTSALTSSQVTTALTFAPASNTVVSDKTITITTLGSATVSSAYPSFTINTPAVIAQTLVAGKSMVVTPGSNTYTIGAAKSFTTYSGTTDASGNFTITFSTAYAVAPIVFPVIPNQVDKNALAITSSVSATGFTVNMFTRATITSLPIIGVLAGALLGAATTAVTSTAIDVLVIEK